jgi:two-component system NtrC family sensor kinase
MPTIGTAMLAVRCNIKFPRSTHHYSSPEGLRHCRGLSGGGPLTSRPVSPAKPSFFWPLRLVVAISLIAPALLFAYATWQNHRAIDTQATERIERALDVLQEHALKAFQTVERSISEINEAIRGVPDAAIRVNESDYYLRFKRTQQALPQIESIWAFDRLGHPLVSSTILPVPRELNNSDRSYFKAQAEQDVGTYIGEVVRARVGSMQFFVVSGRRVGDQPGGFNGVIGVTVTPEHFSEFYRKLTRGNDAFALVRADGSLLARFPEVRSERPVASRELSAAIASGPETGFTTTRSQIDGIERRVGYRKVPGLPLYVTAGIEVTALREGFWQDTVMHLLFGLPIVIAMVSLALYALRRAQRFQEETGRREIAEAALKQAQRLEAIGQLTGGVAHDFNNLLMVVSGNAELLKRHVPAEDRPRRALAAIEIAVQRGTALTRQLLSFSRRQTHEARVVDLAERLPAIQVMLQSSLRGDIAVETHVASDIWRTKVDISELELALLNLSVNARDAMSGGGRLTLSARNETLVRPNVLDLAGDFVVVEVSDTGAGIPSDVLGRVFEPFFTTKEVGKGTGLGLSQVYGFAQQAGGLAMVASELGRGTTVTLFLPRSEEPLEAEATAAAGNVPVRQRLRVLLVEDNPDVAKVARGYLEDSGYVVQHATDVAAAQAILRGQDRFDVVLSDIVMPGGGNGLDLARWVRDQFAGGLPVVLATGYSDQAQAAANEGFLILRKPYDVAALNNALSEVLKKAPR